MPTKTSGDHAGAVPLEELRDADLAHYEQAASAVNGWHNQIPQAIRAWYQSRIDARDGTGQADHVERVAQMTAHRACGNQEHNPAQGKLAGYCVVCSLPWPCAYSGRAPGAQT